MGQVRKNFVVEGLVEVGPRSDFLLFVDAEQIGYLFLQHSGVVPEENEYTPLGRARVSVEWLEDDEWSEETYPT
jgi:hypothetical protein